MENKEQKQKWYSKVSTWLPNLYYAGTLVSLILILAQILYAKRSIVESSEWEKAKMTIENIERFKLEMSKSPLARSNDWLYADGMLPDFSTSKGWDSPQADTLRLIYHSLFEDDTKDKEEIREMRQKEVERTLDAMNAFAYPIIMGYASEIGSYQIVIRDFYAYGSFIMPNAFKEYRNVGLHAKLLYRLWRIRVEMMVVDATLKNPNEESLEYVRVRKNNMLSFEGTEISEASLKKYRKKLDGELKKMQKEIEDFRKRGLE